MRLFTVIVLVGMTIAGVAAVWAGSPPAQDASQGRVTLLGTLAEWKYPESKMLGGASMSDGGNPSLPSVKFQAILTTDDPVEKVVDFYSRKFETSRATGLQDVAAQVKAADAKTVSTQDDSDGRPLRPPDHRGQQAPDLDHARHQPGQGGEGDPHRLVALPALEVNR